MTQADFFRLGGTSPRMLHLLDGMHASDPDRWIPRRLILQNYWLFDQPEVFHFARGNLMLTGQNESGKSTVLVTAITLVLDMMLSPDRVDTMGSNDRSIRYYLIGKDDLPPEHPNHHRERTAYIALEFERGASGDHRTIGIGLRSSRDWTNQKVQRWGFVIDGSRRVGIDLHLQDVEAGRPLRPGELRARLGRGGQVFEDQRAYKAAVNEALFGFQSVDDYERFLEMLHVVRTPKLGEGLNPKRVEQYLKDSLPPIESAAIDNVSDVFSRLDAIEAELERLAGQLAAAERLEKPQEDAVLAAARLAARAYREAARDHDKRQKALEDLLSKLEAARAEVARQEAVQETIAAERADRQGRLNVIQEQYRLSEAFDIEDRLRQVRAEHTEALSAFEALRADRARTQRALEREEEQLQETADSFSRQRNRLAEKLDTVSSAARRSFWPGLESRAGLARDGLPGARADVQGPIAADLARSMIEGEAGERRTLLASIAAAMDALAAAGKKVEDARRASEAARREYEQADDRCRTAAREAESARAGAAAALEGWRAECAELRVPEGTFADVLQAIREYDPQGRRPASMIAPLDVVAEDAQEELRAQRQEREILRRRLDDDTRELEARLRRLSAEPELEPDRSPAVEAARRTLREHGIPHVPLYAACDLSGALAADPALAARVEAGLLDAGLLDALVVPAAETERAGTLLDGVGLGDRWIAPAAADGASVKPGAEWLVAVPAAGVGTEDVRAALRALGLAGGDAAVVDATGRWRLGPLHGLSPAPAEARVRFLGETARREERRRRIEETRAALADVRGQLDALREEIDGIQSRERVLAREWRAVQELPQLQALHDRLLTVRQAEHERDRRRGHADMAAGAVENATRELQQKTHALDRITDDAPYLKGRTRADVDAVGTALAEVQSAVRAIGDDVERMEELRRAYAARARALHEQRLSVEALAPRIAQADVRVMTLDAQVAALTAQLAEANVGRETLAAEIAQLQARLSELKEADEAARTAIAGSAADIRTYSGMEAERMDEARSASIRKQAAELEFRSRLDAYPATLEEYSDDARKFGLDHAMQRLLHDVDPTTLDGQVKEAMDGLHRAFLQESTAFEALSPTLDGHILQFRHGHDLIRLDELHRILEDEQGRNETLLEEKDRELIEQLMLRDVVDAIRAAIRNTKHWVEDINGILGRMQLFKGGIMRLHWEPRPRETADAFEPCRLDDLLTQKGIALDETRREELLEIFRTMISDIRRRNREKELLEDYRAALLRMVDYTQWYSLSVQRKDETGRWIPLTKRLYGQGSGGRRTLDLLLPLIAAVSARLESAAPAAPRLVGFDEAFAGVDDRNAAEIFGLLSELGFCWIMATEKATGLGPEVRGSATYEMLTDGITVAPTLSLWDGARRFEFIGDELMGVQVSSTTASETDVAP